jgi:TRAP-type C4-dicarboxylate transport system permease small subunit
MSAKMRTLYRLAADFLDQVIMKTCTVVMALLLLVNFVDLLQRFIIRKSFSWVMDITLLAGGWVFCLAFAVVVKRKEEISVEFLFRRFPLLVRNILKLVITVLMMGFSLLVVIHSIRLARTQVQVYIYTLKPLTEMHRTIALTVGFALITFFLVHNLWEQFENLSAAGVVEGESSAQPKQDKR